MGPRLVFCLRVSLTREQTQDWPTRRVFASLRKESIFMKYTRDVNKFVRFAAC